MNLCISLIIPILRTQRPNSSHFVYTWFHCSIFIINEWEHTMRQLPGSGTIKTNFTAQNLKSCQLSAHWRIQLLINHVVTILTSHNHGDSATITTCRYKLAPDTVGMNRVRKSTHEYSMNLAYIRLFSWCLLMGLHLLMHESLAITLVYGQWNEQLKSQCLRVWNKMVCWPSYGYAPLFCMLVHLWPLKQAFFRSGVGSDWTRTKQWEIFQTSQNESESFI